MDMNKIRVLSSAEQIIQPHFREQHGSDNEEGQADDRAEEDEDQEGSLVQESRGRPVRARQPPRRYSPDRAEEQRQRKERLSPRERRRAQSRAKFKRGEEPLRTEMRIKERWIVRKKGTETVQEEN